MHVFATNRRYRLQVYNIDKRQYNSANNVLVFKILIRSMHDPFSAKKSVETSAFSRCEFFFAKSIITFTRSVIALRNRSCASNMIIIRNGNKQRTNIKYSERHSEVDCGNDKPIRCRFSPRDISAGTRWYYFPCDAPQPCPGKEF